MLKNPSLDSPAELITSLGSIYDLLNSGEDFENSWKIAQLIENLPPMLKNNKIIVIPIYNSVFYSLIFL